LVSIKYCSVKVSKQIAKATDDIIRKETGADIPDDADEVTGIIVIRFKKEIGSLTVLGDIDIRNAADMFEQTLIQMVHDMQKGESIAVA
jgi:hypothetical protein